MTPAIQKPPEQPYVAIGADANLQELVPVTALVGQVLGWTQHRVLALAAPPFFRYWTIGDEEKRFRQEVGALIEQEVAGDGRVKAGRVPAGLLRYGGPHRES